MNAIVKGNLKILKEFKNLLTSNHESDILIIVKRCEELIRVRSFMSEMNKIFSIKIEKTS